MSIAEKILRYLCKSELEALVELENAYTRKNSKDINRFRYILEDRIKNKVYFEKTTLITKEELKELLDQATILMRLDNTEDIANYLYENLFVTLCSEEGCEPEMSSEESSE